MLLGNKKSIYIEANACPRRHLDATKHESYFKINGFKIQKSPKKADYILYFSCAFRKTAEDSAIERICQLSKYKGELIVGGCIKGIAGKRLKEHHDGFSFTPYESGKIDELFPEFKTKYADVPDANIYYPNKFSQMIKTYIFTFRIDFNYFKRALNYFFRRVIKKNYYLRIADGCVKQHCTYCVIWRAIGDLRSKPMDKCVAEFKKAIKSGYKKIILCADNLGAYGLDVNLTLPDLLRELLTIKGDYAIDIEEIHPQWVIKYADEISSFVKSGKIKMISSSIQSGNDRIIKLMNRRHNKEEFKNALQKIRAAYPKIMIYTQILVGFSSETEEEFEETLEFVKEQNFSLVQVYGYSQNPYITSKEILSKNVPEEIINRRVNDGIKYFKKHKVTCATA